MTVGCEKRITYSDHDGALHVTGAEEDATLVLLLNMRSHKFGTYEPGVAVSYEVHNGVEGLGGRVFAASITKR